MTDDAQTVSFAKDIAPTFAPYRAFMTWRLDITSYDDVVDNHMWICQRIDPKSGDPMPPPPHPEFGEAFFRTFKEWVAQEFPP